MSQPLLSLFRIPRRRPLHVVLAAAAGLTALLWLGMEDVTLLPVVLLALALSSSLIAVGITGRFGGRMLSRRELVCAGLAAGAAGGAGTSLTTAGLMLLKTAFHNHAEPDFGLPVMGAVLKLIPGWAAAGALVGLGAVLLWISANLPRRNQ